MAGKGLILPRGGNHVVFLELRRDAKDYSNETSVKEREAYADGFLSGALPQSISTHGENQTPFATMLGVWLHTQSCLYRSQECS